MRKGQDGAPEPSPQDDEEAGRYRPLRDPSVHPRGWVPGGHHDAFSSEELAKCYAVVILLEQNLPRVRAEAGALIACLLGDPDGGILDYVRRPMEKARSTQNRAIELLARRYGYPNHRWLDRLNEDIRSRERTLDAQERDLMSRDTQLYPGVIVDPAFRDEREGGRRR